MIYKVPTPISSVCPGALSLLPGITERNSRYIKEVKKPSLSILGGYHYISGISSYKRYGFKISSLKSPICDLSKMSEIYEYNKFIAKSAELLGCEPEDIACIGDDE